MSKNILLINGPNLNLLGLREPHVYGSTKLPEVEEKAASLASSKNATLEVFQSNSEGAIIDRIHQARGGETDAIVINPGGLTHTSVALRDALLGVDIPFVEIHISNTHMRESFRHHSYLNDKAKAVVMGLGVWGYQVAIEYAINGFSGPASSKL